MEDVNSVMAAAARVMAAADHVEAQRRASRLDQLSWDVEMTTLQDDTKQ